MMRIRLFLALACLPMSLLAADDYMDVHALSKQLSSRLAKMHDEGKTTKYEVFVKQLARTQYNGQLPAPTGSKITSAELYKQKKNAVLAVAALYKCGKCDHWHTRVASGFLLSPDGLLVTNYHVVDSENTETLGVMTYDGTVYPVKEVVAASKAADVAVLKIEATGLPYLSLTVDSPVGSSARIISNPRDKMYMLTEGIVSARILDRHKKKHTKRLTVTADFGVGSSGAPVFGDTAKVIGMVCSTSAVRAEGDKDNEDDKAYTQMCFRYCIPAELILNLFR